MRPARSVIRGNTIFCDDIRDEVGGKTTYVGAYNGVIAPAGGQFPIVLPKLCLAVTIRWFIDELPAPPMKLKVVGPGDDDLIAEVDFQVPTENEVTWSGEKTEDAHISVNLRTAFFGLTLAREGSIRVRLYDPDGNEFKLGALRVAASPEAGAAAAS